MNFTISGKPNEIMKQIDLLIKLKAVIINDKDQQA